MNFDVAIMQPTYMPWSGYFNLMTQVKRFIFLDDVEFSKSSWHNRNRINDAGEVRWITVPVSHHANQFINQTAIRNSVPWRKKHLKQIRSVYGKAPCFTELAPLLHCLETDSSERLSDLNIRLIQCLAEQLDIRCEFYTSSTMHTRTHRSERLFDLIRFESGASYLSPPGSQEYIEQDGLLAKEGIHVHYQDYTPNEYSQHKSHQWHSHLSVLDVIANHGIEFTQHYIRGV